MTKKVLTLVLTLALLLQGTMPLSAENQKLPNAIWPLFDQEAAYENQGNVQGLIDVRLEIIDLLSGWADSSTQKLDIVTPRYRYIAEGYESLFMYEAMNEALEAYIYYAGLQEIHGGWTHDAVLWAEAKLKNSDVTIRLFAETDELGNGTYYGAKYEPVAGTYFGSAYDRDDRIEADAGIGTYEWDYVSEYFPKKNAAYLIYLEFGENIRSFDRYYDAAVEADTAVQLAWNTYTTYRDMSQYETYIRSTASYLNDLDIPVFVRYGSEMNIAEGMGNAAQYVSNYRYVADILREEAPNVALVWSPNDVTEAGRNLHDYYPGDAYVDWVGLSTYTYYYFGDQVDWGSQQEDIDNRFFTGANANPLSKVAEVIEAYGDRKPIMISESGVSHYSKVAGESMPKWAMLQLARQYEFMPLIYPQVKAMFYFNVDDGITPRNSYALYTNEDMADWYNELVSDDHFLSDVGQGSDRRYAEVGTRQDKSVTSPFASLKLKTYVTVPGSLEAKVKYFVDDKLVKTAVEIPYSCELLEFTEAPNKLRIEVYNDKGDKVKEADYMVTKEGGSVRIEKGEFDPRGFKDLNNAWSKPFVLEIAKRGIIVGSDGMFRPEDYISRAEMTSVISKLGDLPTDQTVSYSDVASWAWYKDYVSGAQKYLTGYGDMYYPSREATREEIITALVKMKGYRTIDITEADRAEFKAAYVDASQISNDYFDYVLLAVRHGIVGGYEDGTLKPKNSMKRGEVAKVLFSTFYNQ